MPIPQDLADRLRSELIRQGQELDWLDLWPDVVRARVDVLNTLSAVDDELAERHPPASGSDSSGGGWSICETLRHLHLSSIGVADIIHDLAAGQPVRNGSYEWEGDVTAHEIAPELSGSFDGLRHAFALHSVDFAAIPHNLPPKPNLRDTFPHMYFGDFNCRTWFIFQALHDSAHLRQFKALLEADSG